MAAPNDIILFHYPYSPYARKITWYLALRNLDYAQCIQPPIMPRDDLAALGVKYRRIPLMSIGRDIYCDTRLILKKLEEHFPNGALGAKQEDQKAMEILLSKWNGDGGVFARAAQLIPPEMPVLQDPKFQKDRTEFSGRSWTLDNIKKGRPEALVHIRQAFDILETTLLADGRNWILKTEKPSLADIEAVWTFHWLLSMPGAVPKEVVSESSHPKVLAWVERFEQATKSAKKSAAKTVNLDGPHAAKHITEAVLVEKGKVDGNDPLKLKEGETVEVYPIDSGFGPWHDQGRLVALTADEVTIAVQSTTGNKEVHLHMPRWGFRISGGVEAKL